MLIAGLPHAVDLLPWLPRREALVYHCADDYAHVQGFPTTLPDLEADLCQQADLVVATSETLCQERRRFNPNTHWVPNGADIEHFSAATIPAAELQHVPKPIIGLLAALGRATRRSAFSDDTAGSTVIAWSRTSQAADL